MGVKSLWLDTGGSGMVPQRDPGALTWLQSLQDGVQLPWKQRHGTRQGCRQGSACSGPTEIYRFLCALASAWHLTQSSSIRKNSERQTGRGRGAHRAQLFLLFWERRVHTKLVLTNVWDFPRETISVTLVRQISLTVKRHSCKRLVGAHHIQVIQVTE